MTETPISILQKATALGLRLRIKKVGPLTVNELTVDASRPWPKDFADTLSQHKARLLELLALPFVMVDSKTLEETIFLCEDEQTRDALVEAGADPWSIYTRAELQVLVAHHRAKPFIPAELLRPHAAKRTG